MGIPPRPIPAQDALMHAHTDAPQADHGAIAFLDALDVREIEPELIEPDTVADDGGPEIH